MNDLIKIDAIEQALIEGDLSKLTPEQRATHYRNVCESLGLNPLTQPFQYLRFHGKLILYAGRNCTDQLRQLRHVSITHIETKKIDDLYIVVADARDASGRTDSSTAAIDIKGKRGDDLANSIMKCETKAKRRATLSICGLSFMDESEVESLPDAQKIDFSVSQIEHTDAEEVFDIHHYDILPLAADLKKYEQAKKYLEKNGAVWNEALSYWEAPKQLERLSAYEVRGN